LFNHSQELSSQARGPNPIPCHVFAIFGGSTAMSFILLVSGVAGLLSALGLEMKDNMFSNF